MPERPPEREIKSSESKTEYDEFAKKSKRNNSEPVDPKKWKNQPTPSDALIQGFKTDLNTAHASLSQSYLKDTALDVQTGMVARLYSHSWTGDITAYRGDMAGLWNNFKVGLENSPVISLSAKSAGKEPKQTDQPFQRLLDLFALAGKRGDISQWLEAWTVAVQAQAVNWQQAAEAAAAIASNIEFTKSLIGDYYRSLRDANQKGLLDDESLVDIKYVVDAASAVLSAIAFEIDRQANAVLTGANKAELFGSRADALQTTLREICNQMEQENGIRQRIERLEIAGCLSGAGRDFKNWFATITPALRTLENSAQTASDLVTEINRGNDPGAQAQQTTADNLAEASVAAAEKLGMILDINPPLSAVVGFGGEFSTIRPDPAGNNSNAFLKDSGLAQVYAAAKALRDKQFSLARQLTDPMAKAKLLKGEAVSKWEEVMEKIRLYRSKNFYGEAERAANDGSLSAFWSEQKDALLGTLDRVANSSAGTETAEAAKSVKKQLDDLFSRGLGPTLDKWRKRKADDTYGLAWQLISTLTAYKRGVESLLDDKAILGAGASQVLDAITATVAAGLESSVRAGNI